MVGLVNDDGAEVVPGKAFQPGGALQGLHAAHHHTEPCIQTGGIGLFHRADKAGGALQLVRCLFQQLTAMRQNEHPVARPHLIGSYRCKHDGLAGAGRQHQQGAGVAVLPLGVDAFTGLLLVGSQFLPHQNAPCVQP